jgi:hypothetical protein
MMADIRLLIAGERTVEERHGAVAMASSQHHLDG